VVCERRHIADERAKAWAEVDAARSESLAARSKVADFEARATVSMKAAAAAREEAEVISGHLQAERDAISECVPHLWFLAAFILFVLAPRTCRDNI
jgi:hypothetical protein